MFRWYWHVKKSRTTNPNNNISKESSAYLFKQIKLNLFVQSADIRMLSACMITWMRTLSAGARKDSSLEVQATVWHALRS